MDIPTSSPVIAGLAIGIAFVVLFSMVFAAGSSDKNSTESTVLNDRTPKITLQVIVCGDSNNVKHSTNSPDNPIILKRGDKNGVDVPLCIFSSSSHPELLQLSVISKGDRTPPPNSIHPTFNYGAITMPAHKGNGTDQTILVISNDVVNYEGYVFKNNLHLRVDENTDPAIDFITIEAIDPMQNWYGYPIIVKIV